MTTEKLRIMMNELVNQYASKQISFQEFQLRTDKIGRILFMNQKNL